MKFCCVGDNCIDYYVEEKIAKPGGNPVNVAVYVRKLGGDSSYIGAVGTDDFGRVMIDGLKSQGVDVSNIQVSEGSTAVTMVTIVNNDRILGDYDEGVMADFKLTHDNKKFISGHDLVVSGYWGNVEYEFESFKGMGLKTAFDFATHLDGEITYSTLPFVDYAFFSNDDLTEKELQVFMKEAYDKGPEIVIVTRGEKGSIAYDGKEIYNFGIIECPVIDTLGAGDSYIAGFLYAIMNGKTILESMEAGATRAAKTIGYDGAW